MIYVNLNNSHPHTLHYNNNMSQTMLMNALWVRQAERSQPTNLEWIYNYKQRHKEINKTLMLEYLKRI